uniref:Pectinesterase inhibitor domain-containing protein n=1 Tax=Ananas comosus var. bracteatus TaxID=296719 RepID=A0A6V7QK66_ANACO|nr:unnamed protein product [Ananas comosus var. bracteatus]
MEGSLSIAVALALAAVWLSAGELSASALAPPPPPPPPPPQQSLRRRTRSSYGGRARRRGIRSCASGRWRGTPGRSTAAAAAGPAGPLAQPGQGRLGLLLRGPPDEAPEGWSESLRQRRDAGAVRDCAETMQDSVERLRRSAREMGRMGRATSGRFAWHLSNVQTWVSGALTDQTTCLDSLAQNAAPPPAPPPSAPASSPPPSSPATPSPSSTASPPPDHIKNHHIQARIILRNSLRSQASMCRIERSLQPYYRIYI